MVEKRLYRSDRYRLIPVSAVYTRGERLHKIRDRPTISAIVPYAFGLFSYSDTFDSNIPLYVPTKWSMFARSSLVSAPGWNVGAGIIAEVVIIITFSIAGMVLCKKMQITARISK